MTMANEVKKFLEKNDLALLHMKFGENEGIQTENGELETLLPEMDGRTDLWTEAIHAASGENITVLRNVYARIMHSDMTEDGKKWWDTVLSICMEASSEELERLQRPGVAGEPENKSAYMNIAAQNLARDAQERECIKRREREAKERVRLEKLREEADIRWQDKEAAESDLQRHRDSRGNGK